MKLSISLRDSDVASLDRFVSTSGLPSRSAGIQHAIALLSDAELEAHYDVAFEEWESSGEGALWDTATGDGITDATR